MSSSQLPTFHSTRIEGHSPGESAHRKRKSRVTIIGIFPSKRSSSLGRSLDSCLATSAASCDSRQHSASSWPLGALVRIELESNRIASNRIDPQVGSRRGNRNCFFASTDLEASTLTRAPTILSPYSPTRTTPIGSSLRSFWQQGGTLYPDTLALDIVTLINVGTS